MSDWFLALTGVVVIVGTVTGAFAFLVWFIDRLDRKDR